MAILYVIWGTGLLALITASFLSAGNVSYALSVGALESARRQASAEAALTRAMLGLLDPRPERRWRVDGIEQEFTWGSTKMRIAIQDELGRIDLNHADQGLLTSLFRSAGLSASDAGSLADKVLDWREASAGKRLNGATEQDYRAAGSRHMPRRAPFQSVDELQLVIGMTHELYQRVEPALTVHSGRQFIDPQFAPREALLALPTMNRDAVANVLAARKTRRSRAGSIDPAIPLGGRAFTVRAEIPSTHGTVQHEAVIRLTDQPLQPYWLLSWKIK
jgi:general secretion pathway protein K